MKDEKISKSRNREAKSVFAKKSFGQNFLIDQNYINKIISALNPRPNETIIEIGPGRGALTEKLIESGANVIAIELERDMISVLKDKFGAEENFQIIEADALKMDFDKLTSPPAPFTVKLVANLPYYISTAILQKLIEQRKVFSEMILMFQKEVVERITAKFGSSERGFLSVLTETYLDTEKLFEVSPNAFRPVPKVWSAIVRLTPRCDVDIGNEISYKSLISAAFKQKRKTIWNNLKDVELNGEPDKKCWDEILFKADVSPQRRAETLTLAEWKKLFDSINS